MILEASGIDFLARIVCHVEDVEVLDRSLFFAGHLIFVGFERGAW